MTREGRMAGDRKAISLESCVAILSDLLVYSSSHNISLKVRDWVEEMEQQAGFDDVKDINL